MGRQDAAKTERAAQHSDHRCPDCGTPTTTYRGSIHKWRCAACVADVVGLAFRPADAQPRRNRVGHPAPPGCDARGREILPMHNRESDRSRMNKETTS
ncbi:hypothetical protein [Nocardia asteroides]